MDNSRFGFKRFNKARALGKRSGLELALEADLVKYGVGFKYEPFSIPYQKPVKPNRYIPDWILDNGIVIEGKGLFDTADRTKHKLIRQQYPDLDVRFVFYNANQKIGKKSATTYALWCSRLGIKYAHRKLPFEWTQEPPNEASLAVIRKLKDNWT